jgi:hypothetical protein
MRSPIPNSVVDTQSAALLQRVTEDRERRCAVLRTTAESQATQIVSSARAEARNTVHNAVIQERSRMDLGMRQARARADIEARRRERQKSRELLEQMWTEIETALEQRWREAAPRRAWIDAAMGQAAALLAGRAWLIESGPDLTAPERSDLTAAAQALGAKTVEWSLQPVMPPGLKIRAQNVCIDATVPGLLARRDAIEAAFLAEYLPSTEKRTDG